jgi:hypothetical protein
MSTAIVSISAKGKNKGGGMNIAPINILPTLAAVDPQEVPSGTRENPMMIDEIKHGRGAEEEVGSNKEQPT